MNDEGQLQGADEVNVPNDLRKSSMETEKLELFSSDFVDGGHGSDHEDNHELQRQPREGHHADFSCDSISDEENMVLTKLSVASSSHNFQQSPYLSSVSKKHKGECTWAEILEEAKDLSFLHKKDSSSSYTSHISEVRSCKSSRSRTKPKFSIRTQLCSQKLPSSCKMDKNEKPCVELSESFEDHCYSDDRTTGDPKIGLLRYHEEDNQELPSKLVSHEFICPLPSMAELLEDLEGKHGQATEPPDLKLLKDARSKERKAYYPGKKSAPRLGSRILDNDDPLEFIGSETSSGDEDHEECNQNHLNFPMEKMKRQTLGDLFLENFNTSIEGSSSLPKNKNTGANYYGRLQQVMQIERERHVVFLKQSQTGQSSANDLRCIMVRILSRHLEAKLIVCHCLLAESTKRPCENDFQISADDVENLRTIIFSSRVCGSVELEVGSFVCIHPPWKEVLGKKKDEKIILCSYFSQIMS